MSNSILFATGNDRKIKEARESLAKHNIGIIAVSVDTDEIQHHDPVEITKAKARAAYAVTNEPVVVQDTSWNIPALGGFPGGYMKDIANWLDDDAWLRVMDGLDRTIICQEHVAYFDGDTIRHFSSEYHGVFVDAPRGGADSLPFERCISLNGKETFAEMHDRGDQASAADTHEHWLQFGRWYEAQA